MDFATKLRKMRLRYDYTQFELARKIGVSTSVIGDIERGARPISAKVAMKLANLFDTDINYWNNEDNCSSNNAIIPSETIIYEDNFTELSKIVDMMLDNNIINKNNLQKLDKNITDILIEVLTSDIQKKILDREQTILKQKQEVMMRKVKSKFEEYKRQVEILQHY